MLLKTFILFTLLSFSGSIWAFEDKALKQDLMVMFAPAQLNSHSFVFEFGYVIPKEIPSFNYHYNAFVEGILKGESEKEANIKSGGIGAKGGIILPTQTWLPLSFQIAAGYAKTSRQKDPWFGKNEQSLSRQDLLFIDLGLMLIIKERYLIKYSYEIDSNKNFQQKQFLAMGVNF